LEPGEAEGFLSLMWSPSVIDERGTRARHRLELIVLIDY
jgi:hypothetical protein